MKILDSIRVTYALTDPEADLVLNTFDEPEGSKVLEVGAQHSPVASMLSKCGFKVYGVDLRSSDQDLNYTHISSDFCALPADFVKEHRNSFDAIISISAIEHFGLNTYEEGFCKEYYDVLAMRYIYDFLKPNGVCYLTVPFGGKFVEVKPHWRVYDWASFTDRLVQDFAVEEFLLKVCENIRIGGRAYELGQMVSFDTALANVYGLPNISCFAKLRKPL